MEEDNEIFAHITFDHIKGMKNRIKVRRDGKAHICYRNGWWWCTIGIGYADGVLMFGETPQIAYEAAMELQKMAGRKIVLEGLANAGFTTTED